MFEARANSTGVKAKFGGIALDSWVYHFGYGFGTPGRTSWGTEKHGLSGAWVSDAHGSLFCLTAG